jgi:Domain of unknown function (DUF5069)
MTPLSLTKQPPRSPKEELGGLCMLPRMIDVARGKLPDGNIGDYQIGRGLSRLVLAHLGMTADEFVECVGQAADDEAVAAQICGRRTKVENRALNMRLRRATVANVPDDLRPSFERFYGADLPKDRRVFDILEEDDAKVFGAK